MEKSRELGEDRHTFKTIGDDEHAEIMALYIDDKQSMGKIRVIKSRSPASIHTQIKEHNEAVSRSGFCPKCKRVHGGHAAETTNQEVKVTQ